MIPYNANIFYLVYPSWADFNPSWEELPLLFSASIESGTLNERSDWTELGYVTGKNCYDFINGPRGNGVIRGIGSLSSKYLWKAALISKVSWCLPPGIPRFGVPDYQVGCLEEKERAEHALGFEKKARTYVPSVSLEYESGSDAVVFVSLTFRKGKVDEEACRLFISWWLGFGVKCHPYEDEEEWLPKKAHSLTAADREHRWLVLQRTIEDAGLILARALYLGCAAKRLSPSNLLAVHLIGNFEGEPEMATKWRRPDGSLTYDSQPGW